MGARVQEVECTPKKALTDFGIFIEKILKSDEFQLSREEFRIIETFWAKNNA